MCFTFRFILYLFFFLFFFPAQRPPPTHQRSLAPFHRQVLLAGPKAPSPPYRLARTSSWPDLSGSSRPDPTRRPTASVPAAPTAFPEAVRHAPDRACVLDPVLRPTRTDPRHTSEPVIQFGSLPAPKLEVMPKGKGLNMHPLDTRSVRSNMVPFSPSLYSALYCVYGYSDSHYPCILTHTATFRGVALGSLLPLIKWNLLP